MSQVTPKRRDKFVASCNFCGTFLQETQGDCKCNVVCPCCGKNMAVVVRKGKVTVFEERHNEDDPAYKQQIRIMSYAAGIERNKRIWCNDLRADIRYHKLCKNVTKAARGFSDINSTFIGGSDGS